MGKPIVFSLRLYIVMHTNLLLFLQLVPSGFSFSNLFRTNARNSFYYNRSVSCAADNNDSSSKTPTIEMYAPNTYNEENVSTISAKSETYSNASPDYNVSVCIILHFVVSLLLYVLLLNKHFFACLRFRGVNMYNATLYRERFIIQFMRIKSISAVF